MANRRKNNKAEGMGRRRVEIFLKNGVFRGDLNKFSKNRILLLRIKKDCYIKVLLLVIKVSKSFHSYILPRENVFKF